MNRFASVSTIVSAAAEAFRPPKRLSVSEGAQQSLFIQQPGGYSGPWSATETPYMIEPMNMLESRMHEAVCFVGPARSGKTLALLDGWLSYAVTCDPGDMLIVQMSQDKARDFSKTRIDRAIRHSPDLKAKMSASGHNDNTHDKLFNHGMWLKIGWPSASQLSGSDYRYVGLTDFDRMPDNIDGEGSAFGLGLKRTQTFLSRGMCAVESSPGRDVTDPNWKPATAHEAPPTNGIMGIYNRSDRRRWYWPCPDCNETMQAIPGLELFKTLPDYDDLLEIVRKEDLKKLAEHHAKIVCPACGALIGHEQKNGMNQRGIWLADGLRLINGRIEGDPVKSNIAGYWLGGVSAAYQNWNSLILRYLQGLREYVLTGAEETLKTTINTDQGMPYMSRHLMEQAGQNALSTRTEYFDRYHAPAWTRLLLASVDIQNGKNGRFVCQVHAIGEGMRQLVVDRFDIAFHDKDGSKRRIEPGVYSDDWDLLTDRVIQASYKTPNGKKMMVHMTVIDTGGNGNTTDYAYQFYRRMRKQGLGKKVMLIKGGSKDDKSPIVQSHGKDVNGRPMKDVPLYILNTNSFKDKVDAMLRRIEPPGLYLHLPHWLGEEFFEELKAEIRLASGKWVKVRDRNEALDLCCYIMAACWRLGLNAEKFNWSEPPLWAAALENNINVIDAESARLLRSATPFIPK